MEARRPVKIILIEDDPTMQSVLKTLLEIEGYQVIAVPVRKKEDEVIAAIRAVAPNVMLLDVHLQGLNGIDLLKRVREDPLLKDTHVIMTSGSDMEEECMQAGANGFLMKPYMPDELLKILKV